MDFCRKSETDERLIVIHLEAHGDLTKTIEAEDGCQFLESDFKLLAEIWRSADASAYNRCMAMLYEIFGRLEESKRGEKQQIIERGVSLLQRSFRDPDLTVKDLARECSVSEVYFRRIFRMQYGISPHRMILNLRFEYSKSLLASGYYSVKEVAKMSGFSDIKHFRSSFKSEFGLTPNAFAKEAGKSSSLK